MKKYFPFLVVLLFACSPGCSLLVPGNPDSDVAKEAAEQEAAEQEAAEQEAAGQKIWIDENC